MRRRSMCANGHARKDKITRSADVNRRRQLVQRKKRKILLTFLRYTGRQDPQKNALLLVKIPLKQRFYDFSIVRTPFLRILNVSKRVKDE